MSSDVEEEGFSDDRSYKKSSSSRVLTGKNLQICFMNEDQDPDPVPSEPQSTITDQAVEVSSSGHSPVRAAVHNHGPSRGGK